tara:strand:- start:819 stop:1151 length:333 start_codon:yes stop_codon:yes gene_type:complete
MDITLIAILSFILLAIVLVLLFLFKSINKKSFKAKDGSILPSQFDLDKYNSLYKKTSPFFNVEDEKGSNEKLLGFDRSFLIRLTKDGFQDLKTLIKYRKQLKSLSDLINT